MIDKQLLDRFLKNECNEEERRQVLEYLDANPDSAAAHLPEEEFAATEPIPWEKERSERAFHLIRQRTIPRPAILLKWSLVAAASVITLLAGLKWLTPGKPDHRLAQTSNTASAPEWLTIKNDLTIAKTLHLPDGSTAELAPGGQIAYHPDFTGEDKRVVRLEGEGQFNVVKDDKKPFMVISGELATTVLGTWFSVISDRGSATIKVHLYSGKVRVETPGAIKWKTKDSVLFLQPGQELVYNRQEMLAVIHSPKDLQNKNIAMAVQSQSHTTKKHLPGLAAQKPDWYMFGGQKLADVFDQLSDYYGVQINYFPSDVDNRYFTGKFSKTDSLEDILNDIALLHDLTLTKTEGIYVFRKKNH